jgi:hypothetical protein
VRLAAILLMLLLAGIARSGDDDDDETDPDLPALSQHLRSIDENLQREADHPETMGEDGDAGDKPDTDATGGMGDVRPGGEHTAEPSPNLDGSEVTTPVPGPTPAPAPTPAPPVAAGNAAVLKPATAVRPTAGAPKDGAAQAPSPAAGVRPAPGLQNPMGTSPLQNPRPDPLATPPPPADDGP